MKCRESDGIEGLGLSGRVYHALLRGGVRSIRVLMDKLDDGTLPNIRNLGPTSLKEIRTVVTQIELLSPLQNFPAPALQDVSAPKLQVKAAPIEEVVKWQRAALAEQVAARQLHPAVPIDGIAIEQLINADFKDATEHYALMLKALTGPDSIAGELEGTLLSLDDTQRSILRRRHRAYADNFEEISRGLSFPRARVRELEKRVKRRLIHTVRIEAMLRMRSALLFAHRENLNISYSDWCESLGRSGIIGRWTTSELEGFDPIELVLYICRAWPTYEPKIAMPNTISYFIRLLIRGMPDIPARTLHLTELMKGEDSRLIDSNLSCSGAVSVSWLMVHCKTLYSPFDLRSILELRDFVKIQDGWFMSQKYMPPSSVTRQVFHSVVKKMLQYCGPLETEDVRVGLEKSLIGSNFPVPPTSILEMVLERYGYKRNRGRWSWNGRSTERLKNDESVILKEILRHAGSVHRFEVEQAFEDNALSVASLQRCLSTSPLFEEFSNHEIVLKGFFLRHWDLAIYRHSSKVLGPQTEAQANSLCLAANVSLGSAGLLHNVSLSRSVDELQGHWHFLLRDFSSTVVVVTDKEVHGLQWIGIYMDIDECDEIELMFNILSREISVSVV